VQVAARISSMMPAATIGNNAIELSMSWQRSRCATSPTTTIDRRGTPPDAVRGSLRGLVGKIRRTASPPGALTACKKYVY
jgi:hypothetical protein